MTKSKSIAKNTIDDLEIQKFSAMAEEWWDPNGKFKTLHKFNPCRLDFIRQKIVKNFHLDESLDNIFKNLNIIDIGCGGGLISEPLARLGANLTAIDASEKNIKIASTHAKKSGLNIDYKASPVEKLDKKYKANFDVVLALEIIEHVSDVEDFIEECADLLKPKGLLFVATLNRTLKSLITAKIGAEYILRWLPKGTHDWKKFLKPYEILKIAEKEKLTFKEICGFEYNILKDQWYQSKNSDVNYMMIFKK